MTEAQRPDVEGLYRTTDAFMAGLEAAGVSHIVLSPGSRSTPLAVSARRRPGLSIEVVLDERAAAFVALGGALASGEPVGLVCTSGTAAANYLPAVVEASLSRVPLVMITADRPPELWGWDAGQTIDQTHLYGRYAREFIQMPIGPLATARAERMAYRAGTVATGPVPGPVHVNWPFRQPFDPPPGWMETAPLHTSELEPARETRITAGSDALDAAARVERGLVAVGPWQPTAAEREAVFRFSNATGWPIVADPLSQIRTAAPDALVVDAADPLMRAGVMDDLAPDVVVRIGGMPTSKAFRLWLEANRPNHVVMLDPHGRWSDPSALFTHRLAVSAVELSRLEVPFRSAGSWTATWVERNTVAREAVDQIMDAGPMSELGAVRAVVGSSQDVLVVGSSMPVRDLDLVMPALTGGTRVFANRGANGIDGTIATAVGVAAALGRPTTVVVGDLTFIHDLGGLHTASQRSLDLTVVVLNNSGGGIFSHLPISQAGDTTFFDELFRTTQRFDFAQAARLAGATYIRVPDDVDTFDVDACAGTVGCEWSRCPSTTQPTWHSSSR